MQNVYSDIYRRLIHPAGPPFYDGSLEEFLPQELVSEHRALARALSKFLESLKLEEKAIQVGQALCEQENYEDSERTRTATLAALAAAREATRYRTVLGRVLHKEWFEAWDRASHEARMINKQRGLCDPGTTMWLNEVVDFLLAQCGPHASAQQLWEVTHELERRLFDCGEVWREGAELRCADARCAQKPVKFQTFRQRVSTRKRLRTRRQTPVATEPE